MQNILTLLSNRRIWATITAIIAFSMQLSGRNIDTGGLEQALFDVGSSMAILISGLLATWSYLKPKQ